MLMTAKEELKTRDGKPYFKVGFRDHAREVSLSDLARFALGASIAASSGRPGTFYKLRAIYRDTNYGPQLEHATRFAKSCEADAADGFSPAMCQPQSRFDASQMFAELVDHRSRADRRRWRCASWSSTYCTSNREALLTLPAATHNHHAFVGG